MNELECVALHLCVKTSQGGFILARSNNSRAETITYWLMVPRDKQEMEYYLVLIRNNQAVDFKFISKEWANLLQDKWEH